MAATGFQRARRPEHKQQRYDAILAAARELGSRRGVRDVSLTDIAGAVGMHKSALLRYFETREEIFLRLAAQEWQAWGDDLGRALPAGAGADQVAAVLAGTLAERPLLCELLSHTSLNLERNVSLDSVRSFKVDVLGVMAEVSTVVGRALPQLTAGQSRDLVGLTATLASGLWQVSNPPPPLARLYAEEPAFAQGCPPFAPTLERALRVFIAGLFTE